jgi:hypothetical protein
MMRYQVGDADSAMQTVASTFTLECQALLIQCLLKMDRPDAAMKELKRCVRYCVWLRPFG